MKFRPCIDIHNGKVKQIVGGSLKDEGDMAQTNFTSEQDAAWYAEKYKQDGLKGGHIILLNSRDSEYFEATKAQALLALSAYPGGMQIGGGITAENAEEYLDAGASHVIVTSYIFREGEVDRSRLRRLKDMVGKERIVLDLSCRKRGMTDYIVTTGGRRLPEKNCQRNCLMKWRSTVMNFWYTVWMWKENLPEWKESL